MASLVRISSYNLFVNIRLPFGDILDVVGWGSRNQHVQKGQKKKMSHTNYVNAAYGMEDNTKNPIYRPNGRYVPQWTPLIQISSDVACTFTSLYMLFGSISFLKTILNCCALNIACTCSCTS
jgi:hypothetical protein